MATIGYINIVIVYVILSKWQPSMILSLVSSEARACACHVTNPIKRQVGRAVGNAR